MNAHVDPSVPGGSADRSRRVAALLHAQVNSSANDLTGSWPVLGSAVAFGALGPGKFPKEGGD